MHRPKRPYFLRALHEWLTDNEFTPYLLVDAGHGDIIAPMQYAQEGRLVLNVSHTATKDLHIDNDAVHFSARFGGVSQEVWLPMACVLGIYAKENGEHGLFFDPSEYPSDIKPTRATPKTAEPIPTPKPASPFKIIK